MTTVQTTIVALSARDAASVTVHDHTNEPAALAAVVVNIGEAAIFVRDLATIHAIQAAFDTAERMILGARS